MENDVKAKTVNGHEEPFPALVLETWALTNVRPKRRTVEARKQGLKLIHVLKRPRKAQQKNARAKRPKKI